MKKIWIAFIFLLLVGCGSKDTCPACSHTVNFAQDVFCPSCGMTFAGMKPDGHETAIENTHLGAWKISLPHYEYNGDVNDIVTELILTLKEDGTYKLEFGRLLLNRNSISYQEMIDEFGSEAVAEESERQRFIEFSQELADYTGHKYNLVQNRSSIEEEYKDFYYDKISDKLLFLGDGTIFEGTRK